MRVLITTMPAPTHLTPYVPLAWALHNAGHEVRVASHPSMSEHITAAGLTAVPVGQDVDIAAAVHATAADERLERITRALGLGDADSDKRGHIRNFVLAAFTLYYPPHDPAPAERRLVDDLVGFARSWRPDLVLWDPLVLASPIAAREVGAVHARVLWGLDRMGWARQAFLTALARPGSGPGSDLMADLMRPTLDRLDHPFSEELLTGQWTIDLMPPRMAGVPAGLRSLSMRRVPYGGAAPLPAWLREEPERPRVCLTLGASGRAFFQEDSGVSLTDLFDVVSGLDIEVVATLNELQLAAIGRVPDNVRTIEYVPLTQLLPTCSAIIHHGGGGTYAAAVAHKVPQIVFPKAFGDFLDNARHVAQQGAGVLVDRENVTLDELADILRRVVTDPSYQTAAEALHDEMLATPGPNEMVPVLERLVAANLARTARDRTQS